MTDPFDPTCNDIEIRECVVYALHKGGLVPFIVDAEDSWVYNHLWGVTVSQSGKLYASRDYRFNGKRIKMFLHQEIMGRVSPPPPGMNTVDHKDGSTFNCRRKNLNWTDHHGNRHNRADYNGKQ